MNQTGPGVQSDVLAMKNLEKKFDTLSVIVGDLYRKHDALLEEICVNVRGVARNSHLFKSEHTFQ
jgi:hypothetical protein